jgi:hypothetical protein
MDALRRDIHIPQAFIAILLWIGQKVSSFQVTKTSVNNKRFYNMSSCFMSVSDGIFRSNDLCERKGTNLF